jgi:hypothetical protein
MLHCAKLERGRKARDYIFNPRISSSPQKVGVSQAGRQWTLLGELAQNAPSSTIRSEGDKANGFEQHS